VSDYRWRPGGRWKSTRKGNSLAVYSTARPVLNGEDEETGRKVLRLVLTQQLLM
jgi:hypothetical protein